MEKYMINRNIGFIGAGNMGKALINGLIYSKTSSKELIMCSDSCEDKLDSIKNEFGVMISGNNSDVLNTADIIILAVKPQIIPVVCGEIKNCSCIKKKLFISIAAGISSNAIESCIGSNARVVRVMPNVAVSIMEGMSAIAKGGNATRSDIETTKKIFNSVGKSLEIDEYLMDAVTGLSGSGPGYIFLIIEALIDAGVGVGLSREISLKLAIQTLLGSVKLMTVTGEHPSKLRDSVTSPGGTTMAGIHALESGALRATLMNAVKASTNRSKEIREQYLKMFLGNTD